MTGEQACGHEGFSERRVIGDATDDHTTIYGYCPACKQWVLRTVERHRDYDSITDELMTPAQIERTREWLRRHGVTA